MHAIVTIQAASCGAHLVPQPPDIDQPRDAGDELAPVAR